MSDIIQSIGNKIEAIALTLVTMDGDDMPTIGEMLNQLSHIKTKSDELANDILGSVAGALEHYLEKVALRETSDLTPFENGLGHLQRCFHSLCNGVEYTQDLSSLYSQLGADTSEDLSNGDNYTGEGLRKPGIDAEQLPVSDSHPTVLGDNTATSSTTKDLEYFDALPSTPDEEDYEIITDFVMESLESLNTIEVGLMDMEENPANCESINAIFRSFHTIKGVSAFLGFMRINKLAHCSENLRPF